MTTWAGGVATSVIVAVVAAVAVYGVHAVLSRGPQPDLSAPPVKVDSIDISPLDNDLLSARLIRPAPPGIYDAGLVPAVGITALIHAEGNRDGLVRIVDIHVLKTCSAPLRGTLVYIPPQEYLDTLGIGFDLDDPAPVASEISRPAGYGYQDLGPSYFAQREYDLKLGEVVTIAVTAETAQHFCEFRFELDLLVNGRPVTQIVTDGGKPFVVSAEYHAASHGSTPDFRRYGALYVGRFTVDPCASNDRLVAENPRTWQPPAPTSGCAPASAGAGGT